MAGQGGENRLAAAAAAFASNARNPNLSIVASLLVELFGIRPALVAIGLLCPVLFAIRGTGCIDWTGSSVSETRRSRCCTRSRC